MKITSNMVWLVVVGALAVGCTSSREVEVAGEVSAPATTDIQGEITLDFFDVKDDGEEAKSIHTVKLETVGSFKETVDVEGDSVRVRALNDRDGDGACTDGEAWAEANAAISDDDKVEPVSLELTNDPCPKAD